MMNKYKLARKERMAAAKALGTHTREEWLALVCEFDARCVRCGTSEYRVERDHIIPVYVGGSDAIDNLQPLCARCNARKGPETINWKLYRRTHGFGDVEATKELNA